MKQALRANSKWWSTSRFGLGALGAALLSGSAFSAFGGETALLVVLALFLLPLIGVWPTMLIPKDSFVLRGIVVGAMLGAIFGSIVGYARL